MIYIFKHKYIKSNKGRQNKVESNKFCVFKILVNNTSFLTYVTTLFDFIYIFFFLFYT